MPTTLKEYQLDIARRLKHAFGSVDVNYEWRSFDSRAEAYAPRLDIAVGPFATGSSQFIGEFDALGRRHRSMVSALWRSHISNVGREHVGPQSRESLDSANLNARCFLAVEIENRGSRKHMLGGAVNAAALGRIGVVVGWDVGTLRALVRLRRYLEFLRLVGKSSFGTKNLLIVSPEQLRVAVATFTTA